MSQHEAAALTTEILSKNASLFESTDYVPSSRPLTTASHGRRLEYRDLLQNQAVREVAEQCAYELALTNQRVDLQRGMSQANR